MIYHQTKNISIFGGHRNSAGILAGVTFTKLLPLIKIRIFIKKWSDIWKYHSLKWNPYFLDICIIKSCRAFISTTFTIKTLVYIHTQRNMMKFSTKGQPFTNLKGFTHCTGNSFFNAWGNKSCN